MSVSSPRARTRLRGIGGPDVFPHASRNWSAAPAAVRADGLTGGWLRLKLALITSPATSTVRVCLRLAAHTIVRGRTAFAESTSWIARAVGCGAARNTPARRPGAGRARSPHVGNACRRLFSVLLHLFERGGEDRQARPGGRGVDRHVLDAVGGQRRSPSRARSGQELGAPARRDTPLVGGTSSSAARLPATSPRRSRVRARPNAQGAT